VTVLSLFASGGVVLRAANAATQKAPPVTLEGKVNNKGTVTAEHNAVSLEADEYYFEDTFVKAHAGSTLTVSIKNDGKLEHTFTVPGQSVDVDLKPHHSAKVKVTVPSNGALLFYCRLHGPNGSDGDLGMQGAVFTTQNQSISNAAAAKPTVKLATTKLGTVLVNGDGATLYQRDSDTPTQVTCTGTCATVWPPAIVTGPPVAGAAIDASKLGTVNGPNGLQATYGGHPLYRFAQDANPGDTKGQGFAGGTWWVLAADGNKITRTG
jgi:predicted lipoprotein with Yx(FWY)xxD motif